MKHAVLKMYKLPVPEFISLGRHVVTSMTGNPDFTMPDPPLADMTTALLNLENAYNDALDGAHSKVILVEPLRKTAEGLLARQVNYVDSVAHGDESKMLGAGMQATKDREAVGFLPAPADVRVLHGNNEGEVLVRFDKVAGAKSYTIDYYQNILTVQQLQQANQSQLSTGLQINTALDDAAGLNLSQIHWLHGGVSTKTSHIVTGLRAGARVWIRVAAIGAAGQGTWSDPATKIVE